MKKETPGNSRAFCIFRLNLFTFFVLRVLTPFGVFYKIRVSFRRDSRAVKGIRL